MANTSLQQQMIDRGHELREEKATVLEQIAANRRSLRDLGTQGLLSEDEYALVVELYPEREGKSDEERLAEAEARAQAIRDKLVEDGE